MSRSTMLKAAFLVVLVVVAVVAQLVVGLPSRAELQSSLDGLGGWAVPAFVALYVAVSLLPVGPSAALTVVGGVLLGFATALAAVLVAAVTSSVIAFLVARFLGRGVVQGIGNERVRALDQRVRDHGLATVVLARLVPVIPFTTLNYALGLTGVRLGSYVAGTALGIVPGTAVYVAVGAYGVEPTSPPFLLALAALVALTVLGLVLGRRRSGGLSEPSSDDGPGPAPS